MNEVFLSGFIGQDAQIIQTNGGNEMVIASLATNKSFVKKDGSKVELTSWHSLVCFGSVARYAKERLNKGVKCTVRGEIEYRKYLDSSGVERQSVNIIVQTLIVL